MKKKYYVISAITLLLGILLVTQFTFFVVPPIGAIPEGKTVVIFRGEKTNFIDNPDAICSRVIGGTGLLCRGAVLASVVNHNTILLRLPYSETLYNLAED